MSKYVNKLRAFFKNKENLSLLFVVIAIAAAAVIVNLVVKKDEAPIAQKEGGCIPLSGSGKQTYDIRTDKPNNLQIMQVVVDPIDVKEGETQTITVKVEDKNNDTITKESGVTANIKTDTKITAADAFVLRLAEDSRDGSALMTAWEGSWIRDDSICHAYMATITATNDKGDEHSVDLAFK